jgi:hypothetical protein
MSSADVNLEVQRKGSTPEGGRRGIDSGWDVCQCPQVDCLHRQSLKNLRRPVDATSTPSNQGTLSQLAHRMAPAPAVSGFKHAHGSLEHGVQWLRLSSSMFKLATLTRSEAASEASGHTLRQRILKHDSEIVSRCDSSCVCVRVCMRLDVCVLSMARLGVSTTS